jgi:hypothetical protein
MVQLGLRPPNKKVGSRVSVGGLSKGTRRQFAAPHGVARSISPTSSRLPTNIRSIRGAKFYHLGEFSAWLRPKRTATPLFGAPDRGFRKYLELFHSLRMPRSIVPGHSYAMDGAR